MQSSRVPLQFNFLQTTYYLDSKTQSTYVKKKLFKQRKQASTKNRRKSFRLLDVRNEINNSSSILWRLMFQLAYTFRPLFIRTFLRILTRRIRPRGVLMNRPVEMPNKTRQHCFKRKPCRKCVSFRLAQVITHFIIVISVVLDLKRIASDLRTVATSSRNFRFTLDARPRIPIRSVDY